MPAGANSKALVRLLDVDPDLGSRLSPERLERARDRLVVRQVRTRAGTFNDVSLASFQRNGFGLLVLEGSSRVNCC